MIKHIVSWTLTDQADPAELAAELQALAGCVPGMGAFEVVLPQPDLEAGFDMMLYSEFDDREALQAYIDYPPHKAFGAKITALRDERRAFDYDTDAL